ncbi:7566_t:CDS:1, partial [Cetraspora pellucida]
MSDILRWYKNEIFKGPQKNEQGNKRIEKPCAKKNTIFKDSLRKCNSQANLPEKWYKGVDT